MLARPFSCFFLLFRYILSILSFEVIPLLRRNSLTLALVLYTLCCALLGPVSLYFSTGIYGTDLFYWYFTQPLVVFLNTLPLVLLGLVLFALLDRAWLAYSVTAAVCLIFSWAQHFKLLARGDPIYAEDLLLVGEAMQMAGLYVRITWPIVLSGVLSAVITLALGVFARGRIRRLLSRFSLIACITAGFLLLFTHYYDRNVSYYAMTVWPEINQWFDTNNYISRGNVYSFLRTIPDAFPHPPEGYDREDAGALLASFPSDDIPEEDRVSIVITQLEAFADLSGLTDCITGADPYTDYHAILAESYHGQLLPNVFAGGTIDTERCVLTGFSALENFRRPSWSYARYFAGQGYTIEGAHAGYQQFYNRRNVNENLGIPNYRFIEEYYDAMVEGVPMDNVFLPDVTASALTAMEEGPVFSFNITYQNHGPYSGTYRSFPEEYIPQGTLSDSDYHIVNNYLWGLEDTAAHMKTMLDTFRESEKPVILVFFGDHKPWLGEQSVTYEALGIDITSQNDASFYNYYATGYLFWANDAAKAILGNDFVGQGPDISPCFLMNVLFEQCGWEGPGFMQLSDAVRSETAMLHATKRYLVDGTITDTLTESQQKLVQDMLHAQYYLTEASGGVHP